MFLLNDTNAISFGELFDAELRSKRPALLIAG